MPGFMLRGVALSLVVCTVALLAAPALAAGPASGRAVSGILQRSPVPGGLAGKGQHLLTSLQILSFPVAGPLAALTWAGRAVYRALHPAALHQASGGRSAAFHGHFPSRYGIRSMYRPSFPATSGFRGRGGIGEIGAAENLTAYIGGKGYDVTDLEAALLEARTALAASNTTAYRAAMMTFRKDIGTKVTAGTIPRMVIGEYLRTLSSANHVPGGRQTAGKVWGFPPRWSGHQANQSSPSSSPSSGS